MHEVSVLLTGVLSAVYSQVARRAKPLATVRTFVRTLAYTDV